MGLFALFPGTRELAGREKKSAISGIPLRNFIPGFDFAFRRFSGTRRKVSPAYPLLRSGFRYPYRCDPFFKTGNTCCCCPASRSNAVFYRRLRRRQDH
jgi:hypothetical protein